MSLSHFEEKSGIVACKTSWGQWWQTVNEVFVEVDVPKGTRGKDCYVVIKTGYLECKVKNDIIFKGELFQNVMVDDSTWTLEGQKKVIIFLAKAQSFTVGNMWESLLTNDYAPDPWTREEMLKKLDLEKFQIENGSGGDVSSPKEKDDESVGSGSDGEAEESHEQAAECNSEASSPPQSPSGIADGEHSEDEVHISEPEGSNQGSDNETNRNERESDESDGEMSEVDKDKRNDAHDSAHEDSVPEINIQSEDEDDGNVKSDDEDDMDEDDQGESEANVHGDGGEVAPSEDVDETGKPAKGSPQHEDSDNEDNDQAEEDADEKVDEKVASDAEGSDNEKNDNTDYGDLIANIFGDSDDDDEEFEGFNDEEIEAVRRKREQLLRAVQGISESEEEKSEAEEEMAEKEQEEEKDEDEGQDEHESEPESAKDVPEKLEIPPEKSKIASKKAPQPVSDDDSDDGIRKMREDFVSDFDLMMQKKKDERSRRRKRKDVDIINDSDDLIADIISQMRQAADEDRLLNKMKKTATKKLKILPLVMSQLKKQDLKMAFLDQGVLNVMADWLAPLPDRSLPNLQIREGMIKQLDEFPSIEQSLLKSSGVGRALMYLYKHPKETKENKERAGKLITEWARPIFNVTTDYHSLTKEEREQRDFDHIPKKRRMRDQLSEKEEALEKKDIDKALSESDKKLRPGDKGWVGRARVPAPSTKDYVVRPKWNVEMECGRGPSKKPINRFERHMRTIQEKRKMSKCQRAVTISIEGRKMAI